MNEKVIYSLKDLILLNQGKTRLLYFEIVEESLNKSGSRFEPESEHNVNSKYSESVSKIENTAQIVVEIKFQKIKFQQKENLLIKIGNIDKIVQGEHDKAKVAYQQALTATVSHE